MPDYEGFVRERSELGFQIRSVMPKELADIFDVRIFARGELTDRIGTDSLRIACEMREIFGADHAMAPRQVHGTAIADARPIWSLPTRPTADGVMIDPRTSRGVVSTLRFADCSPIVVASAHPRPWMAILHSGFHGTTANIIAAAIERAQKDHGEIDIRRTFVWLGPAVGACCYDRRSDDPSTERAVALWHEGSFERCGDFVRFDIHREISSQAGDLGIDRKNIFDYGDCTHCGGNDYISYRRGERERCMLLCAAVI